MGRPIDSTQTTNLVLSALGMATQRRPGRDGLVMHSDRAVRFASRALSDNLTQAGISPSMGAVGSAYDNVLMETFWGACKSSCWTAADGRPASSSRP